MRFDRLLALFLLLPLVVLLSLPKINLLSFQGQTTGIRLDDFLIGLFALLFFCLHYHLRLSLMRSEILILTFVFFGCFSVIVNYLLYPSDRPMTLVLGLFYALRPLEYFIFFYVGLMSSRYFDPHKIVMGLFFVVAAAMILQTVGLVGSITVHGGNQTAYIKTGICSFASETGALLNLLFCYWFFGGDAKQVPGRAPARIQLRLTGSLGAIARPLRSILLIGLFCFLNVLTGHRASIAILLLLIFGWVLRNSKLTGLLLLLGVIGLLALAIVNTPAVYQRSHNLFRAENVRMVEWAWDHTSVDDNRLDVVTGDGFSVDMSWWMRIHKWCWALKNFVHRPLAPLIGLGPGFCGPALDGGGLRLLVEIGCVGLIVFGAFLRTLYRLGDFMRWATVAVVLNMILFDAHLAYKVMSVYLFLGGVQMARTADRQPPVPCLG